MPTPQQIQSATASLALANVSFRAARADLIKALASLEDGVSIAVSVSATEQSWLAAPTPIADVTEVAAHFGFGGSPVFEDNFGGTALNASKWQDAAGVGSGASGGWPWRPEMLGQMDASLATVEADGLHLKATYSDGQARGSVVDTWGHLALVSGLVLVRAKMPLGMESGVWPALWFLPGTAVPKDTNEIDLTEGGMLPFAASGGNSSVMWHYHIGAAGGAVLGGVPFNAGVDLTADFHIYGMQISPGKELVLSLDGKPFATISQSVATSPIELILQNVIADPSSASWHSQPGPSTPAEADLVVDEVAAWGSVA